MDSQSSTWEQNQQQLWRLNSETLPQVLNKGKVNDSDWVLFYTVPEGSFVKLHELLIYNGDASTVKWRMAILDPDDSIPAGSDPDQPDIYLSGDLESEESAIPIALNTGLFPGWQVCFYSEAATDVNFNFCLSGFVSTYL